MSEQEESLMFNATVHNDMQKSVEKTIESNLPHQTSVHSNKSSPKKAAPQIKVTVNEESFEQQRSENDSTHDFH